MKLKNLKKKIRQLEKRLREGPKKLARLKRKLEAAEALKAMEARMKSAARRRTARQTDKTLASIEKKPSAKAPRSKKLRVVKRAKRKLNLTPERRAQLAANMKARWAAKRAAVAAKPKTVASANQVSRPQRALHLPESNHYGG